VSYTLTIHNPATEVRFTGSVTDDLSQVLNSASFVGHEHPATGSVASVGHELRWTGTLDPDKTVTIHYSVRVHEALHGGELVNRLSGPEGSRCAGAEPTPPCVTETVIEPRSAAGPDLALTKTASPHTVHPGGQVTYQLVVHNHGPGHATGVMLEDPSPSGVSFEHVAASPGVHCTISRGLRCALGSVHAGGGALIELTATVASDASGTIVNRAVVWGEQGDRHGSNNTATSNVHVTPAPSPPPVPGPGAQPVSDLLITKHVNRRVALVGERLGYTITVSNHGPDTATNVMVTDVLALPVPVISIHPGQGRCQAGPPITCTLGALHPGARTTLTITAVTTIAGEQTNAAGVISQSRDPHPSSSLAAATTRILTRAPSPPSFTG
jgi:large repetitive protein